MHDKIVSRGILEQRPDGDQRSSPETDKTITESLKPRRRNHSYRTQSSPYWADALLYTCRSSPGTPSHPSWDASGCSATASARYAV
jgi:hypothetical protein